jgi:APA family basic amino acid/polyamine antiporter
VIAAGFINREVRFLASLFSFGVLLAFTAAQLAVIRLRLVEPDLPRPYRSSPNVTIRGKEVPVPALVGAVLTFAVWLVALATHPGARYAGPLWLAAGIVLFAVVRRSRGEALSKRVTAPDELPPTDVPHFRRILVPMKTGIIGEEMVATAVKLATEHGAKVEALHVILVPLDLPIDAPMPEEEARAVEALADAREIGEENGVEVTGRAVFARAIGRAVVDHAAEIGADLIVLGSSPRWRRQSRFFSPTVDYVLRHSPCEVLIVAFPQRVLDEELAAT